MGAFVLQRSEFMRVSVLLLPEPARSVFIVPNGENMYGDFQACSNPGTGALRSRSATAVRLSGAGSVDETELLAYGK